MKALKITLAIAVLIASLTSCTKQELNEDDVLENRETSIPVVPGTGGGIQD